MYTLEKKTIEAYGPRSSGSTILQSDVLNLVYNKYKSTLAPPPDAIKINFVFSHGTGMNKSIWKYHINKLYQISRQNGWYLDSVISVDAAGHGDSALLNAGKLGSIYRWDEGGKDLLQVIKHEQNSTGDFKNDYSSRNILIGHSLGGHGVVMAGFYDPNVVDSVIPIEAVLFHDDKYTDKFIKLFGKISSLIIDDFDSQDDFDEYFKSFSFYKTLHPEVQRDFMEDELYTVVKPDGEIRYKTKTSTLNQMSTYLGSAYSLVLGVKCLELLRVPVCHVVATNGKWNPPESIPYIRKAIPPQYLAQAIDIPIGEHLVNGEHPDEIVKIVDNFTKLRIDTFKKEVLAQDIQIQNKSDRKKIFEAQEERLLSGQFRYGYYGKL